MVDLRSRRAAFRDLHAKGHFMLPNPWDIGSARRLQALGFPALASTSAGLAWSLGRDDGDVTLDEVLAHLRELVAATELPVNADFEAGFADRPDDVAANVRLAVETGVAGLSIEDRTGTQLYDLPLAVERIRASREAIDRTGEDVLLVGRTEGFLIGRTQLDATIERLVAYADAGADVLYAPGVTEAGAIEAIVAAVAPKPVNVLLLKPGMKVSDMAPLGVRRTSVGGCLARAAWAGFQEAAEQLRSEGSLPGSCFRRI
ncbi:MAG TPA: isocitrate lyase/phosphoenolpyruvate mutase family protein [Geminicoccus sp.]|jgi:2-methylisocitrate lyase-like PEP mutase family enzyme|uniref:isocitrate lyase/PEP mutase family protein n=1 Tax=Geminicoccus sp. TaxID=2024832 RepID=UPI002E332BC8|nr:isocitrate lyase/phosphoenolpyruvate mutase family protein [Geminicoccus sp.]HEX2528672.1 isocitrate lyase/phosphoenolpyruvate mutase family protein [Geminicoccus sp.]